MSTLETREVIARALFDKSESDDVLADRIRPADKWDDIHETAQDYWLGYGAAILAALSEAGLVVVPREASDKMIQAAKKAEWWPNYENGCMDPPIIRDIYRAMISGEGK